MGLVAGLIAKMGSTFANPAGGDVNAGFLGALFAGFVGGYIVVGLRKLFSKLPKSLEGIKPVLLDVYKRQTGYCAADLFIQDSSVPLGIWGGCSAPVC